MKRYIKVANTWIDTLQELITNKRCYYPVGGVAYYLLGTEETEVGVIEDEKD